MHLYLFSAISEGVFGDNNFSIFSSLFFAQKSLHTHMCVHTRIVMVEKQDRECTCRQKGAEMCDKFYSLSRDWGTEVRSFHFLWIVGYSFITLFLHKKRKILWVIFLYCPFCSKISSHTETLTHTHRIYFWRAWSKPLGVFFSIV